MVFDKIKKGIETKEAEHKGEKWIAEVKDSEGQWKDLEGWKAVYEPKKEKKEKEKKEESEKQKARKAKAQELALDAAFDKIQEGLTQIFFKTIMEASSTILGKAADVAAVKDAKMAKVLSSINALILSYRFGDNTTNPSKVNQFSYIRKAACADLTEILHGWIPEKGAEQISEDMNKLFVEQKDSTRTMLLGRIDQIISTADDTLDAKALEAMGAAKGAVDVAKGAIDVGKVEAAKDKVEQATGVALPDEDALKAKAEEATGGALPDEEALKAKKDDIVLQFSSMIKGIIMSKMEDIEAHLQVYVDKFLTAVDVVLATNKKLKTAAKSGPQEMTDEMMKLIEEQKKDAQKRITVEIKKLVNMVKTLVINAKLDAELED